jgi:hypothetical protein
MFRKDDKKNSYEAEILAAHKRLQGVKEIIAKYRFVQLVRSLKFYGITFFYNCKMRVPGKKEGQPFLWGMNIASYNYCTIQLSFSKTIEFSFFL